MSSDKHLKAGVTDPQLPPEWVGRIQEYFARLTALDDALLDVFDPAIRQREQDALIVLTESMRRKKQLRKYQSATGNGGGLSMDKPIIRGGAAMMRVHGVYMYSSRGKSYEYPVNALFSLARVNGVWLINGVQEQ